MLDAIRFAAAGVAKKDYESILTHFQVKGGRITGYNGNMSLSADLGVDIEANPLATIFLAAVRACGEETISLNMTPAGRLAVRAGTFRSYVTCIPDNNMTTFLEPAGDTVELGPQFLIGLKTLAPLMGVDASRPWTNGIKVMSNSMFATNNVIVGQYWHGTTLPLDAVIPAAAVREVLRVGQAPTRVQVAPNTITFWFGESRWILSKLLEPTLWPLDKIEMILDGPLPTQKLPEGFFDSVATLKPFLNEDTTRVYVTPTALRTSLTDGDGASVDIVLDGVTEPQAYAHRALTILGEVADCIDWSGYPKPCRFTKQGSSLRGAIVGMRV